MNIVPYSESAFEKTTPSSQDYFRSGLYRPLCSEVSFSIPRETFLKISDIRDAFLIGPSSSSEILEIRMQRNPNSYSHCLIEIRDPKAKDLDRCQRVFLRMFLHPNKTASLDELAAPSFSGREAMQILWKLKNLTDSSTIFFVDGSTQLPCNSNCTESALTSLRPMQVLKSGQSWYERQGASTSSQTHRDFFEPHLEEEYLRAFEEDNAFGTDSPWDYDKFKKHAFANIEMSSVTPEAYRNAKGFLHRLSIKEVQEVFKGLEEYSKIREAKNILDQGLELISKEGFLPKTLGDMLGYLEKFNRSCKKDSENSAHQLLHAFRDVFVSHRNSLFLTLALEDIRKGDISPMAVATATQIMAEIPLLDVSQDIKTLERKIDNAKSHFKDLDRELSFLQEYSCKSESSIAYDLLLGSREIKKDLRRLYEHYLPKRKDGVLEELEEAASIPCTKVMAYSTAVQAIKWRQYDNDRGIDNYMDALVPALDWLGSLTVSDFQHINPGFFEHHQHKLPPSLRELSEDLTIKQFFVQLEQKTSKDNVQHLIQEMLACLKKPFSDASVSLIEKHRQNPKEFSPREVYELWMIAKLTVDQYSIFGLN